MLKTLTLSTLIANHKAEHQNAIDSLLSGTSASTKETRIFQVEFAPYLLQQIASALQAGNGNSSLQLTHPYQYSSENWIRIFSWDQVVNPTPSSELDLANLLWVSLDELLIEPKCKHLTARISRKSFVRNRSMHSVVRSSIRALVGSDKLAPNWVQFVAQYDPSFGNTIPDDITVTTLSEHPFFNRLINIVSGNELSQNFTIIDSIRELNAQFPRPGLLVMKEKVYLSRADNRAYYVDKNPVRHTAGAVIQAVILGTKKQRSFYRYASWYPAKGKNILNIKLSMRKGESLFIVKSDISSFTNSSVNTWLGVLTLLLMLVSQNSLKRFTDWFPVRIHDYFLDVKIAQVLWTYLYYTVGATARVNGQKYVSPGGYLGVKANIQLCIIFFVFTLNKIQQNVERNYKSTLTGQVGGDDATMIFQAPNRLDNNKAVTDARVYLTKYVGFMKEFNIDEVDLMQEGSTISSTLFCKKCVSYTVTHVGNVVKVHLLSCEKLPFLGELLEFDEKNLKKVPDNFRRFVKAVKSCTKGYESQNKLVSMYSIAWCEFYNFLPKELDMRDPHVSAKSSDLYEVSKYLFATEGAMKKASLCPVVVTRLHGLRFASIRERLVWAAERELIHLFYQATIDRPYDNVVQIYTTTAELKLFSKDWINVEPFLQWTFPNDRSIHDLYASTRSQLILHAYI